MFRNGFILIKFECKYFFILYLHIIYNYLYTYIEMYDMNLCFDIRFQQHIYGFSRCIRKELIKSL